MNKAFYVDQQFLSQEEFLDNIKKIDKLKDIKLTLKDLGNTIKYRQLVYWYNEGLLISDPQKDKLNRLDLIDYCWIHTVNTMRHFGLSINAIKEVKEVLLSSVDWILLIEEAGYFDKIVQQVPSEDREGFREHLLSLKRGDKKVVEDSSVFFIAIITFIITRNPISILININNQVAVLTQSEYGGYAEDDTINQFIKGSYLNISLSEIVWKFLEPTGFEIKDKQLEILSENEQEILKAIRLEGVKEIKIRFRDNEPIMLEVTKSNKVELSSRLLELIKAGSYQDINITTQNGKIVNYQNTIKQKLDSRTS